MAYIHEDEWNNSILRITITIRISGILKTLKPKINCIVWLITYILKYPIGLDHFNPYVESWIFLKHVLYWRSKWQSLENWQIQGKRRDTWHTINAFFVNVTGFEILKTRNVIKFCLLLIIINYIIKYVYWN